MSKRFRRSGSVRYLVKHLNACYYAVLYCANRGPTVLHCATRRGSCAMLCYATLKKLKIYLELV